MSQVKPGMRLKSAVCTGQAMVVKAIQVTITCGGVPMLGMDEQLDDNSQADPEHMYKCLMVSATSTKRKHWSFSV